VFSQCTGQSVHFGALAVHGRCTAVHAVHLSTSFIDGARMVHSVHGGARPFLVFPKHRPR